MSKDYTSYGNYERLNSELIIYQDLRTKKKNYTARVLLKNGRYKMKSMKTNVHSKAVVRATEFYDDIKLRERRHLPMEDPSLQECLDYWIKTVAPTVTKGRANAVVRLFPRIIEPFLIECCHVPNGLDVLVKDLNPRALQQFIGWRTNPQRFPKADGRKITTPCLPSLSTLQNEIGTFNSVLNAAFKANLIDKLIQMPRASKDQHINAVDGVRPSINTYTNEQISRLTSYLRTSVINPTNKLWNLGTVKTVVGDNGRLVAVRAEDGRIRSKGQSYLSKVNVYAAFFITKNVGLRIAELFNLKWKDIELMEVGKDNKGRMRHVYKFHIVETKRMRRQKGPGVRQAIGPERLTSIFDKIQSQNPEHCSPDDYVLNFNGKKRRSLQEMYARVQYEASKPNSKGVSIDCEKHESGTNLDLQTILRYYLTHKPSDIAMLQLGGWEIPKRLIDETRQMTSI